MLTPNDYYDSCSIYEDGNSFSEIIDELNNSERSRKEKKEIFKTLCKELMDTYFND